MKTLRGIEIEGDLLKLYNYALAPNGGVSEALDLAEANGLKAQFDSLMKQQFEDADAVFACLLKYTMTSPIVDYGDDAPSIYVLRDCGNRTILSQHQKKGAYEFEIRIRVAVRMRASFEKGVAVDFATKKEAERLYFCDSMAEVISLNKDFLPAVFFEKERLRNKTAETAKRVAAAIQAALHELKNTEIGLGDFIDARNIVVKTNLDDYPEIVYDKNNNDFVSAY